MKHLEVRQQQVGAVVEYWRVALTVVAMITLSIPFGFQGGGGASAIEYLM